MTAFAVILPRPDRDVDPVGVSAVAAALRHVYGTVPTVDAPPGCVLLTAPRDELSRARPAIDPLGTLAVGQAMLEAPDELARALHAPPNADDLELVARAYSAWEERCTRRLSGEFAVAVWDPRSRRLLAARDGLGVRRLYISDTPRAVIATNILSAAVAYSATAETLDDEALVTFLAYGAPDAGRTVYHGIRTLPAGHTLCLRGDARPISLMRHWSFPLRERSRRRPEASEIVDGYRTALERSVADRVRGARASILFSGGIDSTTVAAALRTARPVAEVQAFTAVYRRLTAHDEPRYARIAARCLAVPLTEVDGDAYGALDASWHGEPTPEPLDEPTLSDWRALLGAAAQHAGTALYGEDGDTLFHPPGSRGLIQDEGIAGVAGATIRYLWAHGRLPYLGLRLRERLGMQPAAHSPDVAFLSDAARTLLRDRSAPSILGTRAQPLPPHPTRPQTQARLALGVERFLSPLIAPEVTRQRIEVSCPLLDTRVIQFVMNLPAIPWCQLKWLPRVAYRREMDDRVRLRPKTPANGLHELLVSSWQQRAAGAPVFRHPSLERWIDRRAWQQAIGGSDPFAVSLAWRVLQLDAWLTRRAGIGDHRSMRPSHAAIAMH